MAEEWRDQRAVKAEAIVEALSVMHREATWCDHNGNRIGKGCWECGVQVGTDRGHNPGINFHNVDWRCDTIRLLERLGA